MSIEEKKKEANNYFTASYQELKKVTWPTKKQAVRLTFIVLGFCIIAALVTGALDLGFNRGYNLLVTEAAKIAPPAPLVTTAPQVEATTSQQGVTITPVTAEAGTKTATPTKTPSKK